MLTSIHMQPLRFLPGAYAGLGEPTACCHWQLQGLSSGSVLSPDQIAYLRQVVATLSPEPLHGIAGADWPQAFLAEGAAVDEIASWGVALTVAIQRLARDPVRSGRVLRHAADGAHVALPWRRQLVLKRAMAFGLNLLLQWLQPKPDAAACGKLIADLQRWLASVQSDGMAPLALRFALAAMQRDLPLTVEAGILQLGWGAHAERLDQSFTGHTGNIATRLARSKHLASRALARGGVPIAPTSQCPTLEAATGSAQKMGWPVVVKPSNQDQGLGVVTGIRDEATLQKAYEAAAKFSPGAVIVEKHVDGDDHRMLVVGGTLRMSSQRIAGRVQGNGVHTIAQLMAAINSDPRRGTHSSSLLMTLTLDDEAQSCLAEQGLSAESVPAEGHFVNLRRTANISTGGTALDVSTVVHPDNRVVAERAARLVGLDIAGIDFICPDITRSWREVGGAVIEVNSQPGFRPHWLGDPARDINGEIIDWLFRGKPARIPTAAVAGGQGASTVARLLHQIWLSAGKTAGVCTAEGLWVGRDLVLDRNSAGLRGGRILLEDSAVEVAVMELVHKTLQVYGHACDRYDVVALLPALNSAPETGSMAEADAITADLLARATQAVVLDAEDSATLALLAHTSGRRQILVSGNADAPALRTHLAQGGLAVLTQPHQGESWLVLAEGAVQTRLMPLPGIKAAHGKALEVLFATALACAQGIEPQAIRAALAA